MKIKIISDGIPQHTQVLTEDGQPIENIQAITWRIDLDGLGEATIRVLAPEVELVADANLEKAIVRPHKVHGPALIALTQEDIRDKCGIQSATRIQELSK
jgi:hypothetical protein